jgi:hypothetical protein
MDMTKLNELMGKKKQDLKPKEKTIRPQPGSNRYVILRGWRAAAPEMFFHEFGQHYIKDEAGQIQAVIPCTHITFGRPCATCQGLGKAMHAVNDDGVKKLLEEAKSKEGYILNVLALDSKTPNEPQILEVGKTVFGQIVGLVEEWGAQIFDATKPMIVIVEREGKALNTKYASKTSSKTYDLPAGIVPKNLDEYVAQTSEEQQRRALSALNSVAGLLPAPATGDTPKTAAVSASELVEPAAANAEAIAANPLAEELDSLLDGLDV